MNDLGKILKKSLTFKKILEAADKNQSLCIAPLLGSSIECFSVLYAMQNDNLLVVLNDESYVENVGKNLKAYAKLIEWDGEIIPYLYSGIGTDRYDKFIYNDKIRAIKKIFSKKPFIIVATKRGAEEALQFSIKEEVRVSINESLNRDALIKKIFEMGYQRVNYVEQPLEFAVRGGIIDVYGLGNEWPTRMEFNDKTIELLKDFDPSTQRTLKNIENSIFVSAKNEVMDQKKLSDYYPKNFTVIFYEEEAGEGLDFKDNKYIICSAFEPLYGSDSIHTDIKVPDFLSINNSGRVDAFFEWMQNSKHDFSNIFIAGATPGETHRITTLIGERAIDAKYSTIISELNNGFILADEKLAILTDSEVFSRYQTRTQGFKYGKGFLSRPVKLFEVGDYVVHFSHGIGIYQGVTEMDVDGIIQEVMIVDYADEAKLYVPREHFFLMEKYVGTSQSSTPPLDRLGGTRWIKKREEAHRDINDYAAKILKVEAERELKQGESYEVESSEIYDFEHSFRFQETPDQEKAIMDVKMDLKSPKPMNRLILGDAGFGKTEVAARAAFITVIAGRQTALLAPTTILAEQHYRTFVERMADYPIKIEVLSRFTAQKEQQKVIEGLKKGTVDIVIGTHRLVQKDVVFKNLGLLIIDEEQKFGVFHKDFLLRHNPFINLLNLSATPIPRTLYLSLMGARNMSAIMTPPVERRPIETFVIKEDFKIAKNAIETELKRNGQIFVVHNRVLSINKIADKIKELVPNARVSVAHGRLPEQELKAIMADFTSQKIDCLVATNIIESGLDMPNVNTLVVHEADKFGLAELYQLRGRIGRFNKKAYAYFMFSKDRILDSTVKRRIAAIHEFSKPGGGYHVALKDLEIRGAGNILGTEQSGHIAAIGFDLYCKLLRDSIKVLKGEPITPKYEVLMFLGEKGSIPSTYMPEFQDRFYYYKKFASAETIQEIEEIDLELQDKFGRMPKTLEELVCSFRIKCLCRQKRIIKIEKLKTYVEIITQNRAVKRFRIPETLNKSILELVEELIKKE